MTDVIPHETALAGGDGPPTGGFDQPLELTGSRTRADAIFRWVLIGAASTVLILISLVVIYLLKLAPSAVEKQGIHLWMGTAFVPAAHNFAFGGDLIGSFVIATIALTIATPISLSLAIGINEYAPRLARRPLITLIDLLAAVPSLIFGFWGRDFLGNHLYLFSHWLGHYGAAFPLFRLTPNVNTNFSEFDAGVVVGIMILPLMTSISREIMSQVPREDCEAALALGGTRWGMITDVILPFSRNGVVGGSMLAFGRALGETIAVSLVLSANDRLASHILQNGGGSVSALIVTDFEGLPPQGRSALVVAGLTLLAITLAVNITARVVIGRSAQSR